MNADVGLTLKLLRVEHRLRQREVALHAQLSPSVLSDIENGWRRPSPDELGRICRAMGVAPDVLQREVQAWQGARDCSGIPAVGVGKTRSAGSKEKRRS